VGIPQAVAQIRTLGAGGFVVPLVCARERRNGDGIAITSDRDGDEEIYTMRTDGSRVRQLTSNDVPLVFDGEPNWSPDGRKHGPDTSRGRPGRGSSSFPQGLRKIAEAVARFAPPERPSDDD
jgi:hypothetical protein